MHDYLELLCFYQYRFNAQVFLPHKGCRNLLQQFAKNGLGKEDLSELLALVPIHAPYMASTLEYLCSLTATDNTAKTVCPCDWKEFILAIAMPSPVCALVHPSEKLFDMLFQIAKSGRPTDFSSLRYLQQQIPVLFQLLRTVDPPQEILAVLLPKLVDKAKAPFCEAPSQFNSPNSTIDNEEMEYFPCLPKLRGRSKMMNKYLGLKRA